MGKRKNKVVGTETASKDSVLLITSSDSDNHRFGTGFIIYLDKGVCYILTCAHVVRDVGGPERTRVGGASAQLVAADSPEGVDLAVLAVEGIGFCPPLFLRDQGKRGMPFSVTGFAEFDRETKRYVARTLRGVLGDRIILESTSHVGRVDAWDLKIEDDFSVLKPGYSGSPVADESTGAVFAVASHSQEGGVKGHGISVAGLERIWGELPFSLTRALAEKADASQQRIESSHETAYVNPFQGTRIIEPKKFIGRRTVVQQAYGRIRGGGHTSFVAQRRMGKSSLLYFLAQSVTQIEHESYLGGSNGYLFLYFDSHDVSMEKRSGFVSAILQLAEEKLATHGDSLKPLFQLRQRDESIDLTDLIDLIRIEYSRKVVLLIDEFEYFADGSAVDTPFFKKLRALGDNQRIAYVTASHKTLTEIVEEGQGAGSEFWNIFHTVYLPLFTADEVAVLVTQYLSLSGAPFLFDKADHQFLLHRIGRNPYFFQQAACKLFEWRARFGQAAISKSEYEQIYQSLLSEEWHSLYAYFRKMTPYQRAVVREFLTNPSVLDSYADPKRPNLQERQIIVHGENRWEFFSSLFFDLIREKVISDSRQQQLLAEEKRAVVELDDARDILTIKDRDFDPPLTKMEDKIIRHLLANEGRYCSKEELADVLWPDYVHVGYDAAIQSHMYRLRKKLEAEAGSSVRIETQKGRGYRLSQTDH